MKKILVATLLLILPFSGFFNVTACSPSGGDAWYIGEINAPDQKLPVGVSIEKKGDNIFIRNEAVAQLYIYNDSPNHTAPKNSGLPNGNYTPVYNLNGGNAYFWDAIIQPGVNYSSDSQFDYGWVPFTNSHDSLELDSYITNISHIYTTQIFRDNRPASFPVPAPEEVTVKYFYNGEKGEIKTLISYKVNTDYNPHANAEGIAACNNFQEVGSILENPGVFEGLIIICCIGLLVLVIVALVIMKALGRKKAETTL